MDKEHEVFSTQRFVIKHERAGELHKARFDGLEQRTQAGLSGYSFCVHWPSGKQCFCWRAGERDEVIAIAEKIVERIGVFKVPPRFNYSHDV